MANQYPASTVAVDSTGKVTTTTYSYASPVVAKTADYVIQASDSGTDFTTRGATGAVNFTLPALQSGLAFTFCAVAAQAMTITTAALFKGSSGSGATGAALSGTVITVSAGTAANQYTFVSVECDGTAWLIRNIQGAAAVA